EYRFLVRVDLGENQSRSVAASHAVVISPYFYETAWFPILIILAFGLLIAYGYRLRLRHLIKREAILGKLVERRTEDLRSEKIKTEQQAEQLKILANEKNRFFANISHEFRTPLTLTIGPLTDLKNGKYGGLGPAAKQQIDLSLRNARRLLRLVGQLMDLSRLENKKFELNLQAGNICRYLKTLSEPFEAAAIQKQINFHVILPEEPIFIKFDPGHFDKIVANLLSNAFKFTPERGEITLDVIARDNHAIITVSDTGAGIEPRHIPRLFDRFYQIQKSEMQPGSGIGLSLAKELIELHGGQIRVESSIGSGSKFSVQVPLAIKITDFNLNSTIHDLFSETPNDEALLDSAKQVVNDELDDPDENRNMLKTILIVDDHSDIRAYLKRHLEESYNIIEASSGNEAIALLNQHLPDLVISDVMMSDGDGFSLLSHVRSEPEMDFLPVILLTARAETEDKLSGLNIGANDYITKPFSIREVLARLKNIFDQQKRLAQQIKKGRPVNGTKIHHDTVSAQSTEQQFLTAVKTVIQEELSDENFTVEELSEKVNQSRSNLHRRLTKLTGETPSALIRRIRLELGAQLLAQNAGTVSEIAYSIGFKNVAHFSRVFKEHYSQTPTEFAQSHEKEMT
ncbi:MAG: response regulator, partial [Rhodohalobacter sp.]|uniref:ATP-binding protein n=1 Tax=Rhodohalobacter sp. TaxID=1974210 RepID=UPI0039759742